MMLHGTQMAQNPMEMAGTIASQNRVLTWNVMTAAALYRGAPADPRWPLPLVRQGCSCTNICREHLAYAGKRAMISRIVCILEPSTTGIVLTVLSVIAWLLVSE